MQTTVIFGACVALTFASASVQAQIAVSSNDHKMTQENGVTKNVANPPPDSITILDLGVSPVKVVGTIHDVPGSVVGPPLSVAITPDESLALVASSSKLDPADPTKLVPDDHITVIDLKDKKVIGTVKVGAGAAGISITQDGKRAYVSNRMAGSISILAIDGKQVSLIKTIPLGTAEALVSHIAVTPDGKTAIVASLGDPKANGMLTVVDLTSDPPGKIVGTADIGHEALEGMMMSSDGK